MDATTMHSTPSLDTITSHFPQFSFIKSDDFRWSAESNTIFYNPEADHAVAFLLHELGHALLNHQSYAQDIELLTIERDAWQLAVDQLSQQFNHAIDEQLVQDNLDTYREWLHSRSVCPSCSMTGLQSMRGAYSCLACGTRWKSNEARHCALRRHTLSSH